MGGHSDSQVHSSTVRNGSVSDGIWIILIRSATIRCGTRPNVW